VDFADFGRYTTLAVVLGGVLIGLSIAMGSTILPITIATFIIVLIFYLRTRVTEVMQDEIIYKMTQKAGKLAVYITAPGFSVAGLVLVSLKRWLPPLLVTSGYFLSFTAIVLAFIYVLCYIYYSNKHGSEW